MLRRSRETSSSGRRIGFLRFPRTSSPASSSPSSPDVDSISVGEPVYGLTGFDRDGVAAEYAAVPASVLAPEADAGSTMPRAPPFHSLLSARGRDCSITESWRRGSECSSTERPGASAISRHSSRAGDGAYVIGTASPSSGDEARRFGAHELLDGLNGRFEDSLDPVDLVFDTVGRRAARAVAQRSCGKEGGWCRSPKSRRMIPTGAEIATTYFVVEPNREQLVELARIIDSGHLRPAIDSVFPLVRGAGGFRAEHGKGKVWQGRASSLR